MKKTPTLTFILGIALGAGVTHYWPTSEEAAGPIATTPDQQKSESLDLAPLDVGEVRPEAVKTEVDNSARDPEEGTSEPVSQMEAFERSIASEPEEAQPAEEEPTDHKEDPEAEVEKELDELK